VPEGTPEIRGRSQASRRRRAVAVPIFYVTVPGLDESSPDEAVAAVARTQWEDWRDLRLEDLESPAHRQGVNRLARRLSDIGVMLADRPVKGDGPDVSPEGGGAAAPEEREEPAEEEPGILEKVALFEATMPEWNETVFALAEVMNEMNTLTEAAAAEMARPEVVKKGFPSCAGVRAWHLDIRRSRLQATGNEVALPDW
jgi:hypothetical protein